MREAKNYYQDLERRFTVGRLEFRNLTNSDVLILGAYSVAVLTQVIIRVIDPQRALPYLLFTAPAVGILTVSTPIGLRFRSVYFSIIWFLNCCLLLINDSSLCMVPLVTFLLYHVVRAFFWRQYGKEFIPYQVTRGGYDRYVSKIEGRGGYKEDKKAMKILFWVGLILIFAGFFGIVEKAN